MYTNKGVFAFEYTTPNVFPDQLFAVRYERKPTVCFDHTSTHCQRWRNKNRVNKTSDPRTVRPTWTLASSHTHTHTPSHYSSSHRPKHGSSSRERLTETQRRHNNCSDSVLVMWFVTPSPSLPPLLCFTNVITGQASAGPCQARRRPSDRKKKKKKKRPVKEQEVLSVGAICQWGRGGDDCGEVCVRSVSVRVPVN